MTLKAAVKDINSVPEAQRGFYKENGDGVHILNVEPVDGFALENVAGLKSSLDKEKDARRIANEGLQAFEGIDATAAREALAMVDKFKDFDPEKDAERIASEKFNGLKTQLTSEFEAKTAPILSENEALRASLTNDRVDALAAQAIAAANGSAELLMPIIKSKTKAEFKDGKVIVSVLGDDGQPRIKDHVNGTLFGVDDLVNELRSNEAYGGAFRANSGGSGGSPLKSAPPPSAKADIGGTPEQRRAAFKQKFPDLKE